MHDALDWFVHGIEREKVNWSLVAEIQTFFTSVPRHVLIRMPEHRIGDRWVLRPIQRWLNAGVMVHDEWDDSGRGTAHG